MFAYGAMGRRIDPSWLISRSSQLEEPDLDAAVLDYINNGQFKYFFNIIEICILIVVIVFFVK